MTARMMTLGCRQLGLSSRAGPGAAVGSSPAGAELFPKLTFPGFSTKNCRKTKARQQRGCHAEPSCPVLLRAPLRAGRVWGAPHTVGMLWSCSCSSHHGQTPQTVPHPSLGTLLSVAALKDHRQWEGDAQAGQVCKCV